MGSTSFLSVAEARAVSPSVYRSGRLDDFLPPDDPSSDPVFPAGEEPTADEWFAAWFAADAPAATDEPLRTKREQAFLATQWFSPTVLDERAPTPERPPTPEVDDEVSEYELVPDPDYVSPERADVDMVTPARAGAAAGTPETERQHRRLIAEERQAEEELRRITEARRMAEEVVATLDERRAPPTRRMSSWTHAEPRKSILKNRLSVAPVVQFSADEAPDITEEDAANADGVPEIDALKGYESASSRRTSMASVGSRTRGSRRASMPATTVGIAGSRRRSSRGRRARKSTAGIQMGGRRSLVQNTATSARSRRSSRSRRSMRGEESADPELVDFVEEERLVPPERLAHMRRVSMEAGPPVVIQRGTMIRESVASPAELKSAPEASRQGLVNCAIQCNAEEIDAEMQIMFADFTVVANDGADIPPAEKDAVVAEADGEGGDAEEEEAEEESEPEPPIEYTDQPFEVQTPGHTVTRDQSRSFVPRKRKDEVAEGDAGKRGRRLTVMGADELLVEELPEEQDATDEPESTPQGKEVAAAAEPTSAIQENLGLHIPQSTGRNTPHGSRKTPARSASASRRSRRVSKGASSVKQSLDFGDASPPQSQARPRRKSTRLQGEGSDAPQPSLVHDGAGFHAGVMELEFPPLNKMRRRGNKITHKGKTIVDGVVGFAFQPYEPDDEEDNTGTVDLVTPSPAPSTRSRSLGRRGASSVQRSGSAKSSLRSGSAIKKGSKKSRKGVSFPDAATKSKKRTASEISPLQSPSSRGSKKRGITREMQELVDVVSANLSDNDSDLHETGAADVESGRSRRTTRSSVEKAKASPAPTSSGRSTRSGRKSTKQADASPAPTVSGRSTRSSKKSAKEDKQSPAPSGRSTRSRSVSKPTSKPRRGRSSEKNAPPAEPTSRTSRRTSRSSKSQVQEEEEPSPYAPPPEFDDVEEDGTIHISDDDPIELVEESPRARRSSQRSLASAAAAERSTQEAPAPSRRSGRKASRGEPSSASEASKPRRRAKPQKNKRKMNRELTHLRVNAARVAQEESDDDGGPRRSKRQRFPRLRYWSNEKPVYERRKSQIMPTIAEVVMRMPVEGEESLSSNDDWLARGLIPRQTADGEENSAPGPARGKGKGRKRKRGKA